LPAKKLPNGRTPPPPPPSEGGGVLVGKAYKKNQSAYVVPKPGYKYGGGEKRGKEAKKRVAIWMSGNVVIKK
jgi:hypothetical protein